MSEAIPVPFSEPIPPKKSGPLKWILLGCGGLLVLGLLCFGGCLVAGYLGVRKSVEEIAPVGEAYLRSQSEIEDELGKLSKVEVRPLAGTQVHVENQRGRARLLYSIEGPKGKADATVWLERDGGVWTAVGCEVALSNGRTIRIGRSVDVPSGNKRRSWRD